MSEQLSLDFKGKARCGDACGDTCGDTLGGNASASIFPLISKGALFCLEPKLAGIFLFFIPVPWTALAPVAFLDFKGNALCGDSCGDSCGGTLGGNAWASSFPLISKGALFVETVVETIVEALLEAALERAAFP